MKNYSFLLGFLILFACIGASAQVVNTAKDASTKISAGPTSTANDSTNGWRLSGLASLNFGQAALVNWTAGGENSVSGNALLNASLNYKKNKWAWDNSLNLQYGTTYSKSTDWQKNSDKIAFSSQLGYQINQHWYYALLADFNSQFDEGYDYAKDAEHYISKFMAPAYSNLALGISYKPTKNYSFFLSPITARATFVLDDSLSTAGAFGMENGDNYKIEPGAYFVATVTQNIVTNVDLISKLDVFTPYDKNFGRLDTNLEVLLNCKINKFLTATVNVTLRYYKNESKKLQAKEIFGLGIAYKF